MGATGLARRGTILSVAILFATALPALNQEAGPAARVSVDPRERYQTIDGFGVNFNGTYFREAQKPMIDMLIDDLGPPSFALILTGSATGKR